jgi:hypothetical protein
MKHVILIFSILFSTSILAQNEVKWVMTGALSPSSVALRAKLTSNSGNVRARISTSNPPAAPFIYSGIGVADQGINNLMAKMEAYGLQPGTKYYFDIEADGTADNSSDDIGTFTTPSAGPHSFTFMAGSCNKEPNTKTYNDFLGYNPLFYLNSGDLHYADPNSTDITVHRDALENRVFTRPLQVDLFRQLPIAYVWDDHDYCGNAEDGPLAAGAVNAGKSYREYIPHYNFPERTGSDTNAIYQTFEIGRIKFILSDLRSQRVRNDSTAMGLQQKQWFKNQLVDAKRRNLLICWVGSYSWYGTLDDNWSLNPKERVELNEFMRDSMIENMFIINGDAHMFAIDNGTNGDFTTAQNLPYQYPVMQAGPIENTGSFKGGTYSEGSFYTWLQKAAQYGVVEINDNGGDSICVTMKGYKKDLTTEATSQLVSYSFCRKLGNYIASIENTATDESKIDIYPNPSNGKFYFRSHEPKTCQISILSLDGKVVFENTLPASTVLPVDMSGFASGIYIAKIENDKGGFSKKLVVNH